MISKIIGEGIDLLQSTFSIFTTPISSYYIGLKSVIINCRFLKGLSLKCCRLCSLTSDTLSAICSMLPLPLSLCIKPLMNGRKVRFYEKRHQRQVNRMLVISPMVDNRAEQVAAKLEIEIYSDSIEVTKL